VHVPGLELTAQTEGVAWRATSAEGVRWLLLGSEPTPEGTPKDQAGATVLIRMEPGCGYPPHRHADVEEVLVLAGGYRDERGEHRAGDYVRYEAGSVHAPVALGDPERPAADDNPACVLFASARGGVVRVDPAPAGINSGALPQPDEHGGGKSPASGASARSRSPLALLRYSVLLARRLTPLLARRLTPSRSESFRFAR
jgi:quercetin dioxygenase-like cupin family protein